MNLKKNLGRVATAFLATAMLASLTAVPASAVDDPDAPAIGDTGTVGAAGGEALTELKFNKVLLLPDDVQVPDVTFTFTLQPAAPAEGETLTDTDDNTSTVYPGVDLTAEEETTSATGTAAFSKDTTGREDANITGGDSAGIADVDMVKQQVTIDLSGATFTDAGVYKYILEENDLTTTDKEDYMLSGDRIVYVNVERVKGVSGTADTYKITGISMVKATEGDDGIYTPKTVTGDEGEPTLAKSDGNIYNFYLLDPPEDDDDEDGDGDDGTPDDPEGDEDPTDPDDNDPDDPTPRDHNAYITKFVGGAMGNYHDDFTFAVKVTSEKTGKTYKAYYEVKDEDGNWVQDATEGRKEAITLTEGAAQTITLSHNERLRISGMSSYDNFGATETDYSTQGYDTKYQVKSDKTQNDPTDGREVNPVDFKKPTTDEEKGQNDIQFTNTRNAVSPTGLAMNIAPYALLVVVAAGACFVFLRKRREDD